MHVWDRCYLFWLLDLRILTILKNSTSTYSKIVHTESKDISHTEKHFFCLVRVFQMLLYELPSLLPSIFMGPPKLTFGTDAIFFGS